MVRFYIYGSRYNELLARKTVSLRYPAPHN